MRGDVPTLTDAWPILGLRLECGDLELRSVTDEDALALGAMVPRLLPPEQHHFMPNLFANVLADTLEECAANELRWIWRRRSETSPDDWSLIFAVVHDGDVVGLQDIHARQFPVVREVSSGSFLEPDVRGRGIGLRMRAMVLELTFAHLGAATARSGYTTGNTASGRVSEHLGYEPDGIGTQAFKGAAYPLHRVRLTAERWRTTRPDWLDDLRVIGLDPCKPLLGLDR